jgi:TM2 domain-containing membrane protein YozV
MESPKIQKQSRTNQINQIITMDLQKVDMFMMLNGKYFEGHHLPQIREKLTELDESKWPLVLNLQFKSPDTLMIISLSAGQLGIDRFMLGDTGMGVLKLLTCGGFGIWTIVDWFSVMSFTREKNLETFLNSFY